MATPAEFAAVRPRLFHRTHPEAVEAILARGLLSVSAALDLHGISGEARETLERTRRAETVWLEHPEHGRFPVGDQHPMTDAALRRCLTGGLKPADWYTLLNARTFLWADPLRLAKMLATPLYRRNAYVVLAVDTLGFAEAYAGRLELSRINSGATFAMKPAPRGRETFTALADLPTRELRRVAEATVRGSIPDLARFVVGSGLHTPEPAA